MNLKYLTDVTHCVLNVWLVNRVAMNDIVAMGFIPSGEIICPFINRVAMDDFIRRKELAHIWSEYRSSLCD